MFSSMTFKQISIALGWAIQIQLNQRIMKHNKYPSTLANFNNNYIIFRNVEIFKNYFFKIKKICER
jgi:hypothetical protein